MTSPVWAEDIYIAQTATGGDTGADCANAHSAFWFNTSGNWGTGAGKISAGDTAHLCGTITSSLTAQDNGSSGNLITIGFESGAKLSQPVCPYSGCLNTNGKNYLVVDGGTNGIIENTNSGTDKTCASTAGIWASGSSNIEIKNLMIQNIYSRNSYSDTAVVGSSNCAYNLTIGIKTDGSNNSIHNCTITQAGTAIQDFYGSGDGNVRIYSNDLSASGHILALGGSGSTATGDFYYYNNYVHNLANWDSAGNNAAHTSAIHAYGDGGSGKITGTVWIYNNRFIGDGASMTGLIYLEGGSAWTDGTGTAKIFNNLIMASQYCTGILQAYVGRNHEIYNNTVIGDGNSSTVGLVVGGSTTGVKIKNNYFGNAGHLVHIYAGETIQSGLEVDYNVYANCSGFNCFWVGSTDTGSFSSYRAAHSTLDVHSVDSLASNGNINSNGTPMANYVGNDLGVSLSGLGYTALNFDIQGNAPLGTRDIGAYEFGGSPAATLNAINGYPINGAYFVGQGQ